MPAHAARRYRLCARSQAHRRRGARDQQADDRGAWSGEARRVAQRAAARAHEFDALTIRSVANERDAQGAGIDELAAAVQRHLAVVRFWFTDLREIPLAP